MIKKTVTYTDFDGNVRTEDHFFNLTQSESLDIAFDLPDGVAEEASASADPNEVGVKIIEKMGQRGIVDFIKKLLLKSYGLKSEDGRRHIKSAQITEEFSQTLAFDQIFMELISDDKAAAEFVNGVFPKELADKVASLNNGKLLSQQ